MLLDLFFTWNDSLMNLMMKFVFIKFSWNYHVVGFKPYPMQSLVNYIIPIFQINVDSNMTSFFRFVTNFV
jgi:hypothetical protein